jgi:SAM-dependent methyltransferase
MMQATPPQVRLGALLRCPATHTPGMTVEADHATARSGGRTWAIRGGVLDLLEGTSMGRSASQRLMEAPFYARGYEQTFRPALTRLVTPEPLHRAIELAAAMAAHVAPNTLLDVACGSGNFTRALADSALDSEAARRGRGLVVGIDRSAPMLEQAARRAVDDPRLAWVLGDGQVLPFVEGGFDVTHCAGALHLLPRPAEALAEFARVTRPGGRVIVGTFVAAPGRARSTLQRVAGGAVGFRWFSLAELGTMFDDAGLELVERAVEGLAVTLCGVRR